MSLCAYEHASGYFSSLVLWLLFHSFAWMLMWSNLQTKPICSMRHIRVGFGSLSAWHSVMSEVEGWAAGGWWQGGWWGQPVGLHPGPAMILLVTVPMQCAIKVGEWKSRLWVTSRSIIFLKLNQWILHWKTSKMVLPTKVYLYQIVFQSRISRFYVGAIWIFPKCKSRLVWLPAPTDFSDTEAPNQFICVWVLWEWLFESLSTLLSLEVIWLFGQQIPFRSTVYSNKWLW